jgi:hypothetical protein
MKKLFILLFFICCAIFSFAQIPKYPQVQQSANTDSSILITNALQARGGLINGVYTDTTAANLRHIRQYPGALIYTSSDNLLWYRNSTATAWIQVGAGASGLFARTDARNNTGSPMYFSAASQDFIIDSTANFTVNATTADIILHAQVNATIVAESGQAGITSNTGNAFIQNGNGSNIVVTNTDDIILAALDSVRVPLLGRSTDTTLNKITTINPITGALAYANWNVFPNIYNSDGTIFDAVDGTRLATLGLNQRISFNRNGSNSLIGATSVPYAFTSLDTVTTGNSSQGIFLTRYIRPVSGSRISFHYGAALNFVTELTDTVRFDPVGGDAIQGTQSQFLMRHAPGYTGRSVVVTGSSIGDASNAQLNLVFINGFNLGAGSIRTRGGLVASASMLLANNTDTVGSFAGFLAMSGNGNTAKKGNIVDFFADLGAAINADTINSFVNPWVNSAFYQAGNMMVGPNPGFPIPGQSVDAFGRVVIGQFNNPSAILQVNSTTKGLLIPRMTGTQMSAISSPANGLQIYNTDSLAVCWYNGTVWRAMGTGGSSGSGGITIGTTTITSGTDTRVPFDDGGVVGEDAGMVFAKATDRLTVGNLTSTGFPIISAGTPARIPFFTTAGLTTDDDGLKYDGTTNTLAVTGTGSSLTNGPKMNLYFTGDTNPAVSWFTYNQSNMALGFAAGYNGTDWISSSSSGNFLWYNNAGDFQLQVGSGNSAGTSFSPTKVWGVKAASGNITQPFGTYALGSGSDATDKLEVTGNISLMTAGNKIKIATGSNASIGTATLSSGTVTINTTAVSSSSLIFVVYNTPSGTLASGLSAPTGSIVNGTSFIVNSLTTAGVVNTLDNSTIRWWIIN